MLRLNVNAPCQKVINFYFEKPRNGQKFCGVKRIALPVTMNNNIKECTHPNLPDSDLLTGLVLIHLQKTFNPINNEILLKRMASVGFQLTQLLDLNLSYQIGFKPISIINSPILLSSTAAYHKDLY